MAIGAGSNAYNSGVAVGVRAEARGLSSAAMGRGAVAASERGVAIGGGAGAEMFIRLQSAVGLDARFANLISIGGYSKSHGAQAIAVGAQSLASGAQAIPLGFSSTASGANAIATGFGAKATSTNDYAAGTGGAGGRWLGYGNW